MEADFSLFQSMLNNSKTEDGVLAEFYDKSVKTNEVTDTGLPVFVQKTYIKIRLRDNNDVFDQPASEEHKKRFPVEYNRYLLNKKEVENGTPLNQFAFLTTGQLELCRFRGIFTVERLADLTDEQVQSLGLTEERELANKFLEVSKNNSAIAEFEKKEKAYKAEIKKLKAEIEKLKGANNG
jgi:hypothetical protein